MYSIVRPLLFRLDPEFAHAATLQLLRLVGAAPLLAGWFRRLYRAPEAPVDVFGLRFRNPIGLAAGYDKDALAWRGLAALGFGHIEIGTVTPRQQSGNPRPRIFRLVEDQALINRLGFPSRGAAFVAERIRGSRNGVVLGVNLGINKDTPLELATQDYAALMATFQPLADYLTINISSPNTQGLRQLQTADHLDKLLESLIPLKNKPLLVKLSPDMNEQQLDEALEVLIQHKVDGVIATNTTLSRPVLRSGNTSETGGLSGAPLTALSRQVVGHISARTQGQLPIVAAGGIMSRQDAQAALNAGASLVQVYTGLVYRGPGLVRQILEAE